MHNTPNALNIIISNVTKYQTNLYRDWHANADGIFQGYSKGHSFNQVLTFCTFSRAGANCACATVETVGFEGLDGYLNIQTRYFALVDAC